jgi:hypothetical protein
MRLLIAIAAAGLAAEAILLWSVSGTSTTPQTVAKAAMVPSITGLSTSPALSALEIHNQAHLENLPVQEVDDKTLVFTADAPR